MYAATDAAERAACGMERCERDTSKGGVAACNAGFHRRLLTHPYPFNPSGVRWALGMLAEC